MSFKRVTLDRIERFELENCLQLPDDYKEFLVRGTAIPEQQGMFPMPHPAYQPSGGFGKFYYLDPDEGMDELMPPHCDGRCPKNSVVIGCDQAADGVFALSLDNDDYGTVYWCILGFGKFVAIRDALGIISSDADNYGWWTDDLNYGIRNPEYAIAPSFTLFLVAIQASIDNEKANQERDDHARKERDANHVRDQQERIQHAKSQHENRKSRFRWWK
jgi:hypothetical protein